MLVKGCEVLNKMLEGCLSYNTPGRSILDLSSYLDTSGNALWSSQNTSSLTDYNVSIATPRYKGGLSQSQEDVSQWTYSSNVIKNFGRNTTNEGNCDFVLGSGSTPETYDDYKIESEVLLNLAGKGWSLNSDNKLVLSKTYQNTSGDNITIREVGFIYIVSSSSSLGAQYQKAVLCSREVLAEPIILAPNETVTVSLMNDKIGLTR